MQHRIGKDLHRALLVEESAHALLQSRGIFYANRMDGHLGFLDSIFGVIKMVEAHKHTSHIGLIELDLLDEVDAVADIDHSINRLRIG